MLEGADAHNVVPLIRSRVLPYLKARGATAAVWTPLLHHHLVGVAARLDGLATVLAVAQANNPARPAADRYVLCRPRSMPATGTRVFVIELGVFLPPPRLPAQRHHPGRHRLDKAGH